MKVFSFVKSNIFSIFTHKILFCSFLLIFASFSLFGAEYTWSGGDVTDLTVWQDVNNWGGSGYPTENDTAIFSTDVLISANITVNQILVEDGASVSIAENPKLFGPNPVSVFTILAII